MSLGIASPELSVIPQSLDKNSLLVRIYVLLLVWDRNSIKKMMTADWLGLKKSTALRALLYFTNPHQLLK